MAVESCFHLSTIASATSTSSGTRAWAWHGRPQQHAFSDKDQKLNLIAGRGRQRAASTLSPASSPTTAAAAIPSFSRTSLRRRFACQARNAVDEVLVVVDANWDNMVTKCDKPVLVEFWAPWCGPCRMIMPVIADLAKEYAGKLVCCQVNTDDCPAIASRFGIRSIPTVLMLMNGEKKESLIGAVPKSTLVGIIDKYTQSD